MRALVAQSDMQQWNSFHSDCFVDFFVFFFFFSCNVQYEDETKPNIKNSLIDIQDLMG